MMKIEKMTEHHSYSQITFKEKWIVFIDGEGFDTFLNRVMKGLFVVILFFCVPYLLFILTSGF